jgi:Type II secretion system (T2SS), protein E, N-terminal domain
MQIGQILVEQRWVEPEALARALAEQRGSGKRICSLLIARGLLDPDNAARALANQHGVPGVLQKHLENRDHALAKLLPPAFARACFALPIGRTRSNELIVCVRDPRPELRGILASAVGGPVMIAVAPAFQLEQLIKGTYEPMPSAARGDASVDVDLSTRTIPTLLDLPAAPAQREIEEVEVDLRTRQIAVISDLGGDGLGDLGSMTLVELDDVRVAKDPTQSGQQAAVLPRTTTTPFGAPPPQARTTTSPYGAPSRSTVAPIAPPRTSATQVPGPRTRTTQFGSPPSATAQARTAATNTLATVSPAGAGPSGSPLDATIAALDRATELDEATELAMRYLAGRFHHAVLFTINEGAALGDRGHGGALTDEVIHAITVPLTAPSTIQLAHDTQQLATAAPAQAGAIQDRLERTLGNPQSVAALPIAVDDRVGYVIAVGDASGDPSGATYDLERLGRVLGAAYHRLR